jgi:hypothetical protein
MLVPERLDELVDWFLPEGRESNTEADAPVAFMVMLGFGHFLSGRCVLNFSMVCKDGVLLFAESKSTFMSAWWYAGC